MKKVISLLICVVAVCCIGTANALSYRPSGNAVTKTFDLKEFDGIASSAGIDVYITIGPVYGVKVMTSDIALEQLDIRVKGDILNICYKRNSKIRNVDTKVYVTMPQVIQLIASSGSGIKATNMLTGKTLKISASSAAEIDATVSYQTVDIACSSGAEVALKGEAETCNVTCSSGADTDISELQCTEVVAAASSGVDIEVCAIENLWANASSGADIRYTGNPKMVEISRSSGGTVRAN